MSKFHRSPQGRGPKPTGATTPNAPAFLVGLVVPWVLLTACAPVQRGRYTWGHEVNTIQRCDTNEIYWVRCERPLADRLRAFVENNTDHPYTAIYIEFRGHLLDERAGWVCR